MPGAISRLADNTASPEDQAAILTYVAALAVRHPVYFQDVVRSHLGVRGLPTPERDVLQVLRLVGLRNAIPQVSGLRWRVLESPADAPRFVLNDGGFSVITEQGRNDNGLFVPLGPRIALLDYLDSRPRFQDRRVLTPMSSLGSTRRRGKRTGHGRSIPTPKIVRCCSRSGRWPRSRSTGMDRAEAGDDRGHCSAILSPPEMGRPPGAAHSRGSNCTRGHVDRAQRADPDNGASGRA